MCASEHFAKAVALQNYICFAAAFYGNIIIHVCQLFNSIKLPVFSFIMIRKILAAI